MDSTGTDNFAKNELRTPYHAQKTTLASFAHNLAKTKKLNFLYTWQVFDKRSGYEIKESCPPSEHLPTCVEDSKEKVPKSMMRKIELVFLWDAIATVVTIV